MNGSNKRRVYVSIHHRGALSLPPNRDRLQLSSFHWGILITPKSSNGHDSLSLDVSDGPQIDVLTGHDENPNHDWEFRSKAQLDPLGNGRLIGRVLIGKIPNIITDSRISKMLGAVPLPEKDAVPRQSCVSWTMAAVRILQDAKIVKAFDIGEFRIWASRYADQCIATMDAGNCYDYTAVHSK